MHETARYSSCVIQRVFSDMSVPEMGPAGMVVLFDDLRARKAQETRDNANYGVLRYPAAVWLGPANYPPRAQHWSQRGTCLGSCWSVVTSGRNLRRTEYYYYY